MLKETTEKQKNKYEINGGMSYKWDGIEIHRPSEILKLIADRSKSYETDNIKDILDNYDILSQQEDTPKRFQEHLKNNVQIYIDEKSKLIEAKPEDEREKMYLDLQTRILCMGFYSNIVKDFFGEENQKLNFNVISLENVSLNLLHDNVFKHEFGHIYHVKIEDGFDNYLMGHIHMSLLIDISKMHACEDLEKIAGSDYLSRFDLNCAALVPSLTAKDDGPRVLIYKVYNHNGKNKKERIGNPILEYVM